MNFNKYSTCINICSKILPFIKAYYAEWKSKIFSPNYSILSGKRKHFRISPLSCHCFLPLFTLRKLIYIPQNKEIHHIYKISILKISKHIFIPAKISAFRTAKMGWLSHPIFAVFSYFRAFIPYFCQKICFSQVVISCDILFISQCIYTIFRTRRATISMQLAEMI